MTDKGGKVASGKELIASRLERLFFTHEGGQLGNPEWGSRIPGEFFFEAADEITANEIINEISFLISTYETNINLLEASVDILASNNADNAFIMKATVSELELEEEEPIEIEFFRIAELR